MLANLEELLLNVRDSRSRVFIKDAIECYNVGAYRASVVSTWVAVVYDLIHKFRELEAVGNDEAKTIVARFEEIRRHEDISGSLDYERKILKVDRDRFELLSPDTYRDLERLQQDRNRCVHPTMQATNEPFVATAELARYHIRSALEDLLTLPAIMGARAESLVWDSIVAPYLPFSAEEARDYLKTGPLGRAHPTLVRRIVLRLYSEIVRGNGSRQQSYRMMKALSAVLLLYRSETESLFRDDVNKMISSETTERLETVVAVAVRIPETWANLSTVNQRKLQRYLSTSSEDVFKRLASICLESIPYSDVAKRRLSSVDDETIAFLTDDFIVEDAVIDQAVARYAASKSFAQTRRLSATVLDPVVPYIDGSRLKILLQAFIDNDQISETREAAYLYQRIIDESSVAIEDIHQELLEFSQYINNKGEIGKRLQGLKDLVDAKLTSFNSVPF